MNNPKKHQAGFTLIELVVVIAILGILAGLAIPRYITMQEEARGAKVMADMSAIESAAAVYATKTGSLPYRINETGFAANMKQLVPNYLVAWPVAPSGNIIITGYNGKRYRYKLGTDSTSKKNPITYAWNGPESATSSAPHMDQATLGKTTIDMFKSGKVTAQYVTLLSEQ